MAGPKISTFLGKTQQDKCLVGQHDGQRYRGQRVEKKTSECLAIPSFMTLCEDHESPRIYRCV